MFLFVGMKVSSGMKNVTLLNEIKEPAHKGDRQCGGVYDVVMESNRIL